MLKEITDFLIKAGADANIRNSNGATALIFASTYRQKKIVELLLRKGQKTIADHRGNTTLHHARMQGLREIEEMLR